MATAHRAPGAGEGGERWHAAGPRPVPAGLVDHLFALAAGGPVLAAFDFPIGFPAGFGAGAGYADFPAALDAMGRGAWPELFEVAGRPEEVGARRPFYPRKAGGTRLRHLLDGHGVAGVGSLTRACERGGPGSKAAGCMFWTLGANQVGKAALHGWREVIVPARLRGAALWPFDGTLEALSKRGVTLAESYPGDAYGQLGLKVRGKNDAAVRLALKEAVASWATARNVALDAALREALGCGFLPPHGEGDGFDAVMGLLAALAVARGERPNGAPDDAAVRRWEGWILGKAAA